MSSPQHESDFPMRKLTSRALLGITAAFALLLIMASPASASTGNITAGSFSIQTVNPVETYSFTIGGAPPANAPCADDGVDPSIEVTFDGSGGTLVTGVNFGKGQVEVPAASGNWYYMNLSLGTGTKTGTISGSSITQAISLRATLHPITNPLTDCAVKTTAVCTLQTNMTLSGSWSGGNTPPGTAVVSGGPFNIGRAGACAAPFATRFPATGTLAQATVTGLTVTF